MINLVHTDCPLCGGNDAELLFRSRDREHPIPGEFPVVRCRECSLVYLNPRPDEASLPACYPNEYKAYEFGAGFAGKLQKYLRRRTAKRIASFLPAGARVLEIGCATGDLLVPLRDVAGLDVVGVELSRYAAEVASGQHGLKVHVGTFADVDFPGESFDAVVMRNVLEHLPDPLLDLRRAASVLKSGGYVFIDVPNYDSLDRILAGPYWYAYSSPRHLTIPSVKTLRDMLGRAGFTTEVVTHSLLPNNWIGSLKNALDEKAGAQNRYAWINFRNPVFVLLAAPLTILQKLLRMSGRIEVVARKSA